MGTSAEVPLRIVVVEDHELLLDTLVASLDTVDDLEVVASATSVSDFEQLMSGRGLEPDVVVTDIDLAGRSGRDVVELTKANTSAEVLVITGSSEKDGVRFALDTGAAGFISKAAPLSEFVSAVRAIGRGAAVFPAGLLRQSIRDDQFETAKLTKREFQVLELLAEGRTPAEIAKTLYISMHTVRNHIRALLQKLEARTQLEAVVKAVRAGMIQIQ